MKLKALCNIIYNGEMYHAGETFDADKLMDNSELVSKGVEPKAETLSLLDEGDTTPLSAVDEPPKRGRGRRN